MAVTVLLTALVAALAAFWHYINSAVLPPEMFTNVFSHSEAMGYHVKAYNVTTEDGYVLSLFRLSLQRGGGGKPVLFVHGVGVNGDQFTVNYHVKPIAYRMVDEGFDVWLANTRGSSYSDHHLTLSPSDPSFWDWSAEDIMNFDLPAFLTTIQSNTNHPKVALIGHSQGALVSLGMLAMRPEYGEKVSVLLGIACPGAKNSNESWLFKLLTHRYVLAFFDFIGKNHFFRRGESLWFQKLIARFQAVGYYYIRSRYDSELNGDVYGKFEVYSYRFAGGTSLKNLKYFAQNIYSSDARPRLFDYGPSANLQKYGSEVPPMVDFSKITANLAFFGGKFDQVVKPSDLEALIATLPREKVVFQKLDYHHDHGSFALSRNQEHVDDMLSVLRQFA